MTTDSEKMPAPLNLSGHVALVTGATRGLGLAVARKLCMSGSDVLLNYAHDEGAAEAAVRSLTGLGPKVVPVRADIGKPADVTQLLDDIRRTHGRLDILVHCAASFHRMPASAPLADLCEQDSAVALGPLLHGIVQLTELMPPGGGRIIAISSSGASAVIPGYLSTGMAKAALESLVRYLAVELAGKGITVNTVAAGKLDKPGPDPSGLAARVAARTPAGRLTTDGDVADVVAMLCLPEAGWIHGETIRVDGGLGLLA